MGNLLKQAQKMQRAIEEAERELGDAEITGVAAGGMVSIEMRGDWRVVKVEIADELFRRAQSGEKSQIEDLVRAAMHDGLGKVARLREERRRQVTGGLDLPGFL
jgi:DNA-binding YbaB/EbfC family protein